MSNITTKRRIAIVAMIFMLLVGIVVAAFGAMTLTAPPKSAPMPQTTFSQNDQDTYTGPPVKEAEKLIADLSGPMISIPALDLGAELVQTGAENGWLVLPDPPAATWYKKTVPLDSKQGRSLIASHVDSGYGDQAPFSRLHKIEKGTPIFVRDFDGTMLSYKATDIQVYERQALSPELFSRQGKHELVLVTCSGPTVDAGEAAHYLYNLVVIAEPTS
ncbi:class F sortase [Paeniglutamicibacter sp. NPDC091659]|uniref:class F sortase n=1 Tax=Paeniglutamicibacter sp. NPDC091659 TaxID=3364389 RepID=UPI00382ECCAF